MKTKKYIIAIFLLYLSNFAIGQITKEFDQFLKDPNLTSWKEFMYSPYSNENKELLTEYVIKKQREKSVYGKTFTEKGIDLWYVQKCNSDWKVLEDISLYPDSSIVFLEKFNYYSDSVVSISYNDKGEVDSLFQNIYNPSGSLNKTISRSNPFSGKPILTEYIYNRNSDDLITHFEIVSIQDNDTISYNYSRLYYNEIGLLDSTLVFSSVNSLVSKIVYTYDDSVLVKMETINVSGKVENTEKYTYQTISSTKRIIIVGYNLSKSYIKRIEIK